MYMKDMDLHLELGVTDTDRVTHHFLNRFSGDPVTLDRNYSVEMSFFDVIGIVTEIAKTVATKVKVLMLRGQACSVIAHDGGEPSLLVNVTRSRHCQPDEVKRSHFDVVIVGGKKDTIACRDQLNEALGSRRLAEVTWHYYAGGGRHSFATIILDPPPPIYDSFYPWLKEGVDAYLDAYMASTSSILLMSGEPGTGKTTLLRYLLARHDVSADIAYDEEVLKKDEVFVRFMISEGDGMFIIEDADVMLTPRESDGNRMMARFLNVSDGLIKIKDKKLVFTTNLTDFRNVDPALLRPGRCFDVMRCRQLTLAEAERAAKDAGLPPPATPRTIAQLFNPDSHGKKPDKVGY